MFRARAQCSENRPQLIAQSEGYLASDVTYRTGCGSPASPWLIQAKSGQQIRLSLIDFAHANASSTAQKCTAYATVRDLSTSVTSRVCQQSTLNEEILVATGNQLEVRILTQQSALNHYFMLHFKGQCIVVASLLTVHRLTPNQSSVVDCTHALGSWDANARVTRIKQSKTFYIHVLTNMHLRSVRLH